MCERYEQAAHERTHSNDERQNKAKKKKNGVHT